MRIGGGLLLAIGWIVALLGLAWASAALWIDGPATRWLAGILALTVLMLGAVTLFAVRPAWRAALARRRQ